MTDDPSRSDTAFIYQFYQKYQTVIITNPTEADYKFNFTANNGIKITAPEQSRRLLMKGLSFAKGIIEFVLG